MDGGAAEIGLENTISSFFTTPKQMSNSPCILLSSVVARVQWHRQVAGVHAVYHFLRLAQIIFR